MYSYNGTNKRYAFSQAEVLMLGLNIISQRVVWSIFSDLAKTFGYKVRVTGGTFLTHEITCDHDDFHALLCLTKEKQLGEIK